MLLTSILSLLLSNAVTTRRDISLLFNRVAIIALIYSILHSIITLFIEGKGINLHGGLLNITNITQIFDIFIFFISILILQLTSFYPRKVWIPEYASLTQLLFNNFIFYRTKIINKMGEHLRIIEYPLILLFIISGAVFLISTSDLISVFLSIELQSYGLYLLSTIYRNSELSTTGGLMYFLLGALEGGILLFLCLILPNSGNALKLIILSDIWKYIRGWINHSCTVTSYKMNESEIGNRGSKSALDTFNTVKEQRVNGSRYGFNLSYLRCTLMGFERNYRIGVLSNQINTIRLFTTSSVLQSSFLLVNTDLPQKFNPWWYTGFIDGEGYFSVGISKNKNTVGWQVKLEFGISIHEKDRVLLEQIQRYFSAGNIFIHPTQKIINYRVLFKDLEKVIGHLDQYPLITQKKADFELFKQAYELVLNKQHLKLEGLQKIVAIKASMNKGLSSQLKAAFIDVISVTRPLVVNEHIQDLGWLAGFVTAEGCFFVNIQKSITAKSGIKVHLDFCITQHIRDEVLMARFIKVLGCGNIYTSGNICRFRVTNLTDITMKIIPILKENHILGVKFKDFEDFCQVAEMLKAKKHLTPEGLNKIGKIKAGMNTGRA